MSGHETGRRVIMEFKSKLEGKVALVAGATRGAGPGIACMLAQSLAHQLRKHKIAVVALTPGILRSEAMLDHFGVTEENWRDGIKHQRDLAYSETPFYIGKAVVALACDRRIMTKSGQALVSGKLAREYGFTDMDGTEPIWCY
jgi:hypothetical protein